MEIKLGLLILRLFFEKVRDFKYELFPSNYSTNFSGLFWSKLCLYTNNCLICYFSWDILKNIWENIKTFKANAMKEQPLSINFSSGSSPHLTTKRVLGSVRCLCKASLSIFFFLRGSVFLCAPLGRVAVQREPHQRAGPVRTNITRAPLLFHRYLSFR